MFEYEGGFTVSRLPDADGVPRDIEALLGVRLLARANLIWQEHCSECAMPSCYSSCMFYTPRRDYKCRRFRYPIAVHSGDESKRTLVRVGFGKWARLLAYGPQPMLPVQHADRRERNTITRYRVEQALPLGRGMLAPVNRMLGNRRWRRRNHAQRRVENRFFLMEVINPQPDTVELTISVSKVTEPGSQVGSPMMAKARVEKGHNIGWFSFPFEAQPGQQEPQFCLSLNPSNPDEHPDLTFGLLDVVALSSAPGATLENCILSDNPAETPKVKCVVWDLDNTVWRGVLVEDGIENLELRESVVDVVRKLDSKGILNSIASKNDPELALEVLDKFGIREYFLCPAISWGTKSSGIRKIAENLNLGVDAFAFVDDQPFERAEVQSQLPAVLAIDPEDVSSATNGPRFSGDSTSEAASRREMYIQEEKRREESESFGSDYEAFIKGCDMEVEIHSLKKDELQRAYELSQRTNQLNIATTRYTKNDLTRLAYESPGHEVHVVRAKDKFGDYGIVGLSVFSLTEKLVEDLMFSCRIQSKFVDDTYLAWLSETTQDLPGRLKARFTETKRNGPARQMLIRAGFRARQDEKDPWELVEPQKPLGHFQSILKLSVD